ncbi:hypothetical protein PUNSTDRAFT_138433 [Punctularia strigosozonata HHB-11173 SS5]|uniref:Uncharacterized protein n=1 Tax=Punctularia strigosozonata (strain HHB-11173) TaxID=741275 RepID=R7S3L3_PUNST|nr:uncharacterized protein PUNSTDRAFT_138433 [Punctularia strigosozonata HHB-11173 SS5]EIN04788.1 hypothetical protein PUNSTDRAFT_138433 [Punctularia strigosozonata HHB-11173 SS5]
MGVFEAIRRHGRYHGFLYQLNLEAYHWDIAQRVAGEDFESKKTRMTGEDLLRRGKEVTAKIVALHDPKEADFTMHVYQSFTEYQYSIHIHGNNTVANAKAAGALDARELYPNVEMTSLKEFANKGFYANPLPLYDDGY